MVWSLNDKRRHMLPAQRNAAAVNSIEVIEKLEEEAKLRVLRGKGEDGSGRAWKEENPSIR